jgi:hypothetical protein
MISFTPVSGDSFLRDPQDFSLVLGGPVFQVLRRSHLTDDALGLVRRRIVVISLFCRLPLLVISALEGKVLGGGAVVPFLSDLEVHVRFLVLTMMPLEELLKKLLGILF